MTKFKNKNLFTFRLSLLYTVSLMAFVFSLFIATLSLLEIFPLTNTYMLILYGFGFINLLVFVLVKYNDQYYFLAINIILFSALFTFIVMTKVVLHDEFRLVWFFLVSFASFIMGGKHYGFFVTILITAIVLPLYFFYDINLSAYAIFTFFIALIVFNTFAFFFLQKIENDEKLLEFRVVEEVEKQQMQEQMLLRQCRMANMGEMIDAIAHQWRQPLMQNNMMLLNLYDEIEKDSFDKKYALDKIENLSKVTTHMSRTIEDFRNLLKPNKQIGIVKLDEVVKEIELLMKNNLKEIELIYEKSNIEVLGFKSELVQVFVILISNSIEILKQKSVSKKIIKINIVQMDESIEISIEDNAGGVSLEIIDKVFDPYFSTKEEQGGTGLGLYIAKIIVEQNMQGTLKVVNTQEGAKFTINWGGEIDGDS